MPRNPQHPMTTRILNAVSRHMVLSVNDPRHVKLEQEISQLLHQHAVLVLEGALQEPHPHDDEKLSRAKLEAHLGDGTLACPECKHTGPHRGFLKYGSTLLALCGKCECQWQHEY